MIAPSLAHRLQRVLEYLIAEGGSDVALFDDVGVTLTDDGMILTFPDARRVRLTIEPITDTPEETAR
jgi:hypothetical protein